MTQLQQRYQGCLNTPSLWTGGKLSGISPFFLTNKVARPYLPADTPPRRLGKLVEQFIFYRLKQNKNVRWITDNLQIRAEDKTTVGELDAIFYQAEQLIHLEVAYKFYLYDTLTAYDDPLAYWIGPNRKDRLVDKLSKSKSKQFPLLFHPLTQQLLENQSVSIDAVRQQMCFKAQLFLPLDGMQQEVGPLNQATVVGFHLPGERLIELEKHYFYLPPKLDWLIVPHQQVNWLDFTAAQTIISEMMQLQRSPMVWIRNKTGELRKGFVTFW